MHSRIPPLAVNLLLVLISSIAGLLVLELGLRSLAYAESRALARNRPQPAAGSKARMVHMIRPSEHLRQIYEMRPNLDVIFRGERVTTNRHGFRDRDYSDVKSPGTKRILGLGDSIMFGWGVAQEESYPELLETMLNERFPSTDWEVLNTAVPGYNTAMEMAVLEAHGLSFDPDMVVVGFCGNDFDLPQFIAESENHWRLDRSYLADLVARRLSGAPPEEDQGGDGFGLRRVPGTRNSNPIEVPDRYRDMVGWESYERSLATLKALSEQHAFEVVNVFFGIEQGKGKTRAIELSSQLGFHVVDLAEAIRAYLREHGIPHYRPSELVRSEKDPHPSALGHRLCAEEILRYLTAQGLVP